MVRKRIVQEQRLCEDCIITQSCEMTLKERRGGRIGFKDPELRALAQHQVSKVVFPPDPSILDTKKL
jgi:hypothetical protein